MYFTLLFIAQPFLASWALLVKHVLRGRHGYPIFATKLLCVCVAVIASSKLPESDLANYLYALETAGSLDPSEFWGKYKGQPLYFGFLYLLGISGLISKKGFVFISVFATLYIVSTALRRLGMALGASPSLILAVTAIAILYPSFFDLSSHILRQMLAGSIVMLGLTCNEKQRGQHIVLLIIAVLIHSSALFLAIAATLRAPKRLSPAVGTVAVIMVFISLVFLANQLAPLALNLPYLGPIAWRLTFAEGGAELRAIPHLQIAMLTLCLGSALYLLANYKRIENEPLLEKISRTTVLLSGFVLSISFIPGLSELSLRFYFYLYFFGPMILLMLAKKNSLLTPPILSAACIMPAVFVIGLERSTWTYAISGFDVLSTLWFMW